MRKHSVFIVMSTFVLAVTVPAVAAYAGPRLRVEPGHFESKIPRLGTTAPRFDLTPAEPKPSLGRRVKQQLETDYYLNARELPAARARAATNADFQNAAVLINSDLQAGETVTAERVEAIITKRLAEAAQKIASEPSSGVTFEILSGNLKVDASKNLAGVKITGGTINIYRFAKEVAKTVAACMAMRAVSEGLVPTAASKETKAAPEASDPCGIAKLLSAIFG